MGGIRERAHGSAPRQVRALRGDPTGVCDPLGIGCTLLFVVSTAVQVLFGGTSTAW